jgi:DNA-binding transcriptional MerR regulator
MAEKAPGAFKTIGELSAELGVAQHILRYWETKFPQLRPLQRAGNRRYYRPADVDLARRINRLLSEEGYTIRGVQKVLRGRGGEGESAPEMAVEHHPQPQQSAVPAAPSGVGVERLMAIRDGLASALYD